MPETLQLSGTESVWLDLENGFIQFWSGKSGDKAYQQMVEYPIEYGLAIMDFLKKHEDALDEYVVEHVLYVEEEELGVEHDG